MFVSSHSQSVMLNSFEIALTNRVGCVEMKAPSPPRRDGFQFSSLTSSMSELSRPTIGTICVSLLNGPFAAAPKCGANVGIRATIAWSELPVVFFELHHLLGQSSLTNFDTIFPPSLTNTRPPIPKSRSHQVLFSAPAYGATPSCT